VIRKVNWIMAFSLELFLFLLAGRAICIVLLTVPPFFGIPALCEANVSAFLAMLATFIGHYARVQVERTRFPLYALARALICPFVNGVT